VSARTVEWLGHHQFHQVTGVAAADVHFVRKRSDKAAVCALFGITHFVDDRVDVLEHLRGLVPQRFLFLGGVGNREEPLQRPPGVRVSHSWAELAAQIRSTVSP
jgi:hypothetical protein